MRREARRTAEWYLSLPPKPLQDVAREGLDARAILEIAYRTAHGIGGFSRDSRAALRWYVDAAELGSVEAMYNLSVCYLRGLGTRRSLSRSRYWARECERRLRDATSDATSEDAQRSDTRACANALARVMPNGPLSAILDREALSQGAPARERSRTRSANRPWTSPPIH